MQIAILGRQPKISLAELESLYGAGNITPVADYAALVKTNELLPQPRLGGTIKSAKLLTRLEKTDLDGAFSYLEKTIPEHLQYLPEGKLQFGISIYGFKAQKNRLLKQMLSLKKIIKKSGRSVRIIENKSEALDAAQVLYNKLTGPLGWELLLIKDGADVILAQTYAVQDIDAYAARDFERPKRDAFVGMLPPKLAQIMINLAVGKEFLDLRAQSLDETNSKIQDLRPKNYILDPFCGTGVVLQEALLMGYNAYGTDISEKMTSYSQENLQWLKEKYAFNRRHSSLEVESSKKILPGGNTKSDWILNQVQDDKPGCIITQADATTHQWDFSKIQNLRSKIYIVCETYLGTPLTALPQADQLDEITAEADTIAEGFLKNIAPQLKTGTRLCLALPAWALSSRRSTNTDQRAMDFKHLKMLDHLGDLGYNRLDLVHAEKEDLIYHRENQIVARELTILVRS